MNQPNKKIRVVGDRRPEIDLALFAQALVAFATHLVAADSLELKPHDSPDEPQQEAS
jgi:hypothetical protein